MILQLRRGHVAPPHNRSSYGTEEGVRSITRDDLVWAHAQGCVPKGSVLAIAGDVDHDAVLASLTPLLGAWKGEEVTPAPITPGPRGVLHEDQDTDQTHIGVCYDGPNATDDDVWLERVATNVLSGGMSSRLFTEVREKRSLVYSVSARFGADKSYGRTTAYAGTTPERANETLSVLIDELERINTPEGKVTQDEFDRALVGIKSRLVFSGESSGARARALVNDIRVLGEPKTLEQKAAAYDAVTLDRLNDYLSGRSLGTITVSSIGKEALQAPASIGA